MHIRLFGLFAATMIALASAPAHAATLTGDRASCTVTSGSCSRSDAEIGSGPEFILSLNGAPSLSIDLSSDSLLISSLNDPNLLSTSFSTATLTLSDLDFTPARIITGISNFASNVGNLDISDISVTNRSVSIDLGGTQWQIDGSNRVSFDLVTAPVSTIPLPAGLPLLLAGLGALAVLSRRRAQPSQHL